MGSSSEAEMHRLRGETWRRPVARVADRRRRAVHRPQHDAGRDGQSFRRENCADEVPGGTVPGTCTERLD